MFDGEQFGSSNFNMVYSGSINTVCLTASDRFHIVDLENTQWMRLRPGEDGVRVREFPAKRRRGDGAEILPAPLFQGTSPL